MTNNVFLKKYLRQPSIDFIVCNLSSSGDVVYKERLLLKLFHSIVLSILTYSCEIWSFENCAEIEKVHLRFCKKILKVRQTTSNYMVYGELGRYPLNIHINVRMIGFWLKLKSSNKYLIMYINYF